MAWFEPAFNLPQSCFGYRATQLIFGCFCSFTQTRRNGFAVLFKVAYTVFCALHCEFLSDRRMDTGLALLNSSSINMGQKKYDSIRHGNVSQQHGNKKSFCRCTCSASCTNMSLLSLTFWVESEWVYRKLVQALGLKWMHISSILVELKLMSSDSLTMNMTWSVQSLIAGGTHSQLNLVLNCSLSNVLCKIIFWKVEPRINFGIRHTVHSGSKLI